MKVITDTQKFQPVTVLLESEEEAAWLWACLNISDIKIKKQHSELASVQRLEGKTLQLMCVALDSVYCIPLYGVRP